MSAQTYFKETIVASDGLVEIEAESLPSQPEHQLIDVRSPDEYHGDLGHIDGSQLVVEKASDWSRNTPLVVVCRSGRRSARAVRALQELGFRCVANLRGGMMAYAGAH